MKLFTNLSLKNAILPIIVATTWIGVAEFFRNQILFKSYWTEHYHNIGLLFPEKTINGAVWGIWSLGFAVFIYFLARRMSLIETFLTGWFAGFVLMWLVIGNLGVLPTKILWFAVPLSLLEAFVASWIIKKLSPVLEK